MYVLFMKANLNLKLGWFRAAALGIFDPLGMRAAATTTKHVQLLIINIFMYNTRTCVYYYYV